MRDYDEVDLFTDVAVSTDPEPYLEHLRGAHSSDRGRSFHAMVGAYST